MQGRIPLKIRLETGDPPWETGNSLGCPGAVRGKFYLVIQDRSASSLHQPLHPGQLFGQAHRLQVVVRLRERPGVLAKPLPCGRIIEQRTDLAGQSRHVEEIHQPSGLVVLDRLAQRLRVAVSDSIPRSPFNTPLD